MEFFEFIVAVGASIVLLSLPMLCAVRFVGAIFSSKVRQTIWTHWKQHVVLAAVSTVIVIVFISSFQPGHALFWAKAAKSRNSAEQIRTAIIAFETEYGEPPSTNKNAALIKILTGGNQRGIEFISVRPRDMNARGEMVDAWGQPYRVSMVDPSHPVVFSTSLYSMPVLARMQGKSW